MDYPKKQKEHTDQAIHNEQFMQYVKSQLGKDYLDWRLTVIFYVCVHCVDAKLAEQSITVRDHLERNMYVAGKLAGIATDYLMLYTESKNARYDPDYRVTVDEARIQFFEKIMDTIKAIVPIQ